LTKIALPMFMNISYHPRIFYISVLKKHIFLNLLNNKDLRFYISEQILSEASFIANDSIDVLLIKEDYFLKKQCIGDLILLEKLQEYKDFYKGKILLHFIKEILTPYEQGYRVWKSASVFSLKSWC